jgi:NAD(P)-dependent dehydrogenase (short-subunit alcohol dehydrogenase family)
MSSSNKRLLIIGASRGLGYALAEKYLKRGWDVAGTVRGSQRTKLHDLEAAYSGRLAVESVDINDPAQVAGLCGRLAEKSFDLLLVNAGSRMTIEKQSPMFRRMSSCG